MALLEVQDIVIRFGGVTAVAGVSFEVEERQICGLIGPNGAGKTTTFNCISGIYRPNSGRVRFAGQDITTRSPDAAGREGHATWLDAYRGGLPLARQAGDLLG